MRRKLLLPMSMTHITAGVVVRAQPAVESMVNNIMRLAGRIL